jgi:hypothetical protein
MKHLLGILLFSTFVGHSLAKEPTKAQLLFERCAMGVFIKEPVRTFIVEGAGVNGSPLSVPFICTGHTALLDDGTAVSFEQLEYQAEVIAQEGKDASEAAFEHLDDKRAHMRVIAFEVLCLTAKRAPVGYRFGRPGAGSDGEQKWREKAKRELKMWIAEPAGADQPATIPADKVPVKDQPSTPTSKDCPR